MISLSTQRHIVVTSRNSRRYTHQASLHKSSSLLTTHDDVLPLPPQQIGNPFLGLKWRHDIVLAKLVSLLQKIIKDHNTLFCKTNSSLSNARDWILISDSPGTKFQFPLSMTGRGTIQRPDIVLYSSELKQVSLLELTCCKDEILDKSHIYKQMKYGQLAMQIAENGWTVTRNTLEVSADGSIDEYQIMRLCRFAGISGFKASEIVRSCTSLCKRCSTILVASLFDQQVSTKMIWSPTISFIGFTTTRNKKYFQIVVGTEVTYLTNYCIANNTICVTVSQELRGDDIEIPIGEFTNSVCTLIQFVNNITTLNENNTAGSANTCHT